jgi:hypothetical protein
LYVEATRCTHQCFLEVRLRLAAPYLGADEDLGELCRRAPLADEHVDVCGGCVHAALVGGELVHLGLERVEVEDLDGLRRPVLRTLDLLRLLREVRGVVGRRPGGKWQGVTLCWAMMLYRLYTRL